MVFEDGLIQSNPLERMRFLGSFGIIREALRIGIRNPSFIPLATIFSLPLFCISLLHELLLQYVLREAFLSTQLRNLPPNSNSIAVTRLTHMMSGRVLVLGLLYLIPLQFSNLLTAVATVHSASAIHAGARLAGLPEILHNTITKTRWKGPLVTYAYKFLLSSISSLVMVFFILLGPLLFPRNLLLLLVSVMGAIMALGIWLVLSAWWNMGVVVSILEDSIGGGLQALSISHYLSKGNRVRGFVLMLLDFVWLYGLSWSTLHVRGSFSSRVVLACVNTGLVCVGKVMKWVVCMVYYHDCKRRCREKVDLEEGGEDELLMNVKDFSLV